MTREVEPMSKVRQLFVFGILLVGFFLLGLWITPEPKPYAPRPPGPREAQVLDRAIHAHIEESGKMPGSIGDLVPRYLQPSPNDRDFCPGTATYTVEIISSRPTLLTQLRCDDDPARLCSANYGSNHGWTCSAAEVRPS